MPSSKTPRLSIKPKVQPSVSDDEASDWVNHRNGADATAKISTQTLEIIPKEISPVRTKRITFEVTEEQHQATKVHAVQQGMTIKELMQALLDKELSNFC
jgi:predicted DNA binding CopG/RHH family protein